MALHTMAAKVLLIIASLTMVVIRGDDINHMVNK
jgi:hypothetical protein